MISTGRRSDAGHALRRPEGGASEFLHSYCISVRPCGVPCRAGNDSEVSVKMKECLTHAVTTRRYVLV